MVADLLTLAGIRGDPGPEKPRSQTVPTDSSTRKESGGMNHQKTIHRKMQKKQEGDGGKGHYEARDVGADATIGGTEMANGEKSAQKHDIANNSWVTQDANIRRGREAGGQGGGEGGEGGGEGGEREGRGEGGEGGRRREERRQRGGRPRREGGGRRRRRGGEGAGDRAAAAGGEGAEAAADTASNNGVPIKPEATAEGGSIDFGHVASRPTTKASSRGRSIGRANGRQRNAATRGGGGVSSGGGGGRAAPAWEGCCSGQDGSTPSAEEVTWRDVM